jgi:hypothetical protein
MPDNPFSQTRHAIAKPWAVSREPPATAFFGRIERWEEIREVVRRALKRLPFQSLELLPAAG